MKFFKNNTKALRELIFYTLNSNIERDDFIEYLQNIPEFNFRYKSSSEKEFRRLLYNVTGLSDEFLEFRDFCSLIDKFAKFDEVYQKNMHIPRMFKNMIVKRRLGKYYPVNNLQELEEKISIFNKFTENYSKVNILDISTEFLRNFNIGQINKISLEGFIEICQKALYLAEKEGLWNKTGKLYILLGNIFLEHKKYEQAQNFFRNGIKIHFKIKDWRSINYCHLRIGDSLFKQGNFESVEKHYKKVLQFNLINNNPMNLAKSYVKLGNLYSKQSKYNKAINNYNEVLKINYELENWNQVAQTYHVLGNMNRNLDNFELAKNCYEDAIMYQLKVKDLQSSRRSYKLRAKDLQTLGISNRKMGDLYSQLGKYKEALKYYLKAYGNFKNHRNRKQFVLCSIKIGNLFLRKLEYKKALKYYKKTIFYDISNENWQYLLLRCVKIANIYSKLDDFKKTLRYSELSLSIAIKTEEPETIYKIKTQNASILRKYGKWNEAKKYYEEISLYYIKNNILDDSTYFKIQSLKCQAKISENSGDFKEVSKLYLDIVNKYKQINNYRYSTFYYLVHEIFNSDSLSQEGNHDQCLDKLLKLKIKFKNFLQDERKFTQSFILDLIKFRIKQINLYIYREQAFLSEIKGDFDSAIEYSKKASITSKNLLSPRFNVDFQLYQAISVYYLAHLKRLEFQKYTHLLKANTNFALSFLSETLLPLYYQVKNLFNNLKQTLRERNITYEILLFEGKKFELEKNVTKAILKYSRALEILKEIDNQKINQYSSSLTLLQKKRRGFPIEDNFLRKPLRGPAFIQYCNLPDIDLMQNFFHLNFENFPQFIIIGKEHNIILKVHLDELHYKFFKDDIYFIHFCETGQLKQFLTERDSLERTFQFKIPIYDKLGEKIYQFEILDNLKNVIKSKSIKLEYRDPQKKLKIKIERGLKNKSAFLEELHSLLRIKDYKTIENKLDDLFDKEVDFEGKFFIKMFLESIVAFNNYLNFDFKSYLNRIVKIINKIDDNLILITSIDKKAFLEHILAKYLKNFRNSINHYIKNSKKNIKIQEIHPIILELYEEKIYQAYESKDFALTLQLTLAFFEKIMNKILFCKYSLDIEKINWQDFNPEMIRIYKDFLRNEIKLPKSEEIILKQKLEFESSKCLLMVLDSDFKEFFQINYKNLNLIRQARNKSYLEHGTTPITEDIVEKCLNLVHDIKKKLNLFKEFLVKDHLKYFESFIDFLHKYT